MLGIQLMSWWGTLLLKYDTMKLTHLENKGIALGLLKARSNPKRIIKKKKRYEISQTYEDFVSQKRLEKIIWW